MPSVTGAHGNPQPTCCPSLYDQVQAWKDNGYCTGAPMDDTLFIVDSAYFDLLDLLNGEDAFSVLGGMTTSIAENIGILYGCGARNLLFAYIPPLEASPIAPPPRIRRHRAAARSTITCSWRP